MLAYHRRVKAVAPPKAWLSWSSGKDSAFALQVLRQQGDVDVVGLLVTVNESSDRVAMHEVPRALVAAQAERLDLPLRVVELPFPCPNDVYEARVGAAIGEARHDGVSFMAFGDLFLADIRAYREEMLADSGLSPIFPLWDRPTKDLAHEMIGSGLRAVITAVDTAQLDGRFAGRPFDAAFLTDLPTSVDACGERGEFHTFVWDAPTFRSPIPVSVGEAVERHGFAVRQLGAPDGEGDATTTRE